METRARAGAAVAVLAVSVLLSGCIRGNIDEAYYRENPDGSFWLVVRGWLFETEGRQVDGLRVRLDTHDGGEVWFDVPMKYSPRPDVSAVHGAGGESGYDFEVPVDLPLECAQLTIFATVDGRLDPLLPIVDVHRTDYLGGTVGTVDCIVTH